VRGRAYAAFAAILLALSLPGALASYLRLRSWALPSVGFVWDLVFSTCMAATALHLVHLVRAQLRSPWFRLAISIPGQAFVAAGFLAGVWQLALLLPRALVAALGWDGAQSALRYFDLAPFALAIASIGTSQRRIPEWVRVHLNPASLAAEWSSTALRETSAAHGLVRVPVERRRVPGEGPEGRVLRIVQVSDPHLGPWQPVAKLRDTLAGLVAQVPDLVLLTGDFLTMESNGSPGALEAALAPLREVSDRCYAIFGNHDHEAPQEVAGALAAVGIRLLIDDEAIAATPVGAVQILGADHVWRGRDAQLARLFARHPRRDGIPRLLLLHDPSGFAHVPDGEVDLTLSGHTHGGQVGLVALGLEWTVLRRSAWPDHGLFARGASLLYVHRGTGFYGFPLRIGVPSETSVLEVVLP
jgi:predicted MPP superfamily phosphohydrolase